MFNSKKRVKDLSAPGSAAGPAGTVTSTASVPGGLPGLGPTSAGNIQKLEMAKRLALKINAQKNLGAEAQVGPTEVKCVSAGGVFAFIARRGKPEEQTRNIQTLSTPRFFCHLFHFFGLFYFSVFFLSNKYQTCFSLPVQDVMQQATNAILRGGTIMTPSVSAKTIAEQLAEKINAKLNYTPVEKLEEERQAAEQAETVKRYEEELEINDFPQVSSARFVMRGSANTTSCSLTQSCSTCLHKCPGATDNRKYNIYHILV